MTTPGGVPNLPQGALTIDTLASKTQDMSGTAMKSRAVERFPSIFDNSTGLSAASSFTPFGILTDIWAGVISLIANADPADVQGPDDLPALVLDFIESLPFVGQFVTLLEALLGNYTGDDTTLLSLQDWAANVPLIGPLLEAITGSSSTGGGGMGGLTSFFDDFLGILGDPTDLGSGSPGIPLVGSIPILGPLIQELIGMFAPGSGATGVDGLGGVIGNLMSVFGGGDLGLGGGTSSGDGGGGGGVFDIFGALQSLLGGLVGAGGLASGTPIPAGLFGALSPATSNNVQQDPTFTTFTSLQGNGQWVWDWPGADDDLWGVGPGCVRTHRPGTVTIYWVRGSWEATPGAAPIDMNIALGGAPIGDPRQSLTNLMSNQTVPIGGTFPVPGDNLLDWENFDVIEVPYAAALYPLGYSVNQGVSTLISLIKSIPGKFILMGASLGGAVISTVYEECRNPNGILHYRNDDLLMGWAEGNPRKQIGRSFPGGPAYCPVGRGVIEPNLSGTEDRWWEWSLAAGTYPAHGSLTGVTYAYGDPVSCMGDDAAADDVRALVKKTMDVTTLTANSGNEFLAMLLGAQTSTPDAAAAILRIMDPVATPHVLSMWEVQPFLAAGDTRSFWQYTIDYINNTFADEATPPAIGIHHQLEGNPVVVQPFHVLHASADVEWMNVVATGPAILVGVNAYDADGKLILGVGDSTPTVVATQATISDPPSEASWQHLSASFVMPENAASARLVFDVSPEAMTTGTVWFRNGVLEVTQLMDSALLANIENIPQISSLNISGVQGEANLLTAIQNLLDGLATANAQSPMTGVQLSEFLATQGVTAISAGQALALAVDHEQTLALPTNQPVFGGLQPTGEVTFELQSFPNGALTSTSVTAGTTLAGFINCTRNVTKGFIEFLAQGTGGSGVYVNVYSVDRSSGVWTRLYASADISSQIPNGSWGWVEVSTSAIAVTVDMVVALEIVSQSTTTSVASKSTGVPNHPSVIPPNAGATRATASTGGVSPTSLSAGQPTYSSTQPFVSFGISNVPPAYQLPSRASFPTVGPHVYNIPVWAQNTGVMFDAVLLGGGGKGSDAAFIFFPGNGGMPGEWEAQTLIYGTDIPDGTTQLVAITGNGGLVSAGGTSMLGYADTVPVFDAVAAGSSGLGTSRTWSHTATAGAYALVAVMIYSAGTVSSVTYDGAAMTSLGPPLELTDFSNGRLQFYGKAGVGGGSKTVVVNLSGSAHATANSISYTGVDAVGTLQTATGRGHNNSGIVDCGPGQIIVQAFGSDLGAYTAPTGGTNRYLGSCPSGLGPVAPLSISDASASGAFAVTGTGNDAWASITVPLTAPDAATLLTAAGGAFAANTSPTGLGAGTQIYNDVSYFGGTDVTSGSGAAPGGGGPGAAGFGTIAGPGAAGEVWVTVRQT